MTKRRAGKNRIDKKDENGEESSQFDLDGTVWDATGQVFKIWNRVFERRPGLTIQLTRHDMENYMGKTMEEIGGMLFPELDEPARKAIMEECGKEEIIYLREYGAALYDGARETIAL